jgi:hypothetical protein
LLLGGEKAPLDSQTFDGGVYSAETLGRGNTIASNRDTPASGSENPASIQLDTKAGFYATALVDYSKELKTSTSAANSDPLDQKVLNYMAAQAGSGVVFYEPLARSRETQITNPATPSTDFREVDVSGDALGFAVSDRWKSGTIGISFAYLHSSLATVEHVASTPDDSHLDTAHGVRMNLGFRYPTGPVMWGILFQNIPGFLWWKSYSRTNLPVKARIGSTWKAAPGILFSLDTERRFYDNGSDVQDFLYFGSEYFVANNIVLRAGVFGDDVYKSSGRTVTGGVSYRLANGMEFSYAMEQFKLDLEKVRRSFVSIRAPLNVGEE